MTDKIIQKSHDLIAGNIQENPPIIKGCTRGSINSLSSILDAYAKSFRSVDGSIIHNLCHLKVWHESDNLKTVPQQCNNALTACSNKLFVEYGQPAYLNASQGQRQQPCSLTGILKTLRMLWLESLDFRSSLRLANCFGQLWRWMLRRFPEWAGHQSVRRSDICLDQDSAHFSSRRKVLPPCTHLRCNK